MVPTKRTFLIAFFALILLASVLLVYFRFFNLDGSTQAYIRNTYGDETEVKNDDAELAEFMSDRDEPQLPPSNGEDRQSPSNATSNPISGVSLPDGMTIQDFAIANNESIRANPPEPKIWGVSEIDAESAYRLHSFYRWCNAAPRTSRQFDARMKQFENRIAQINDEDSMRGAKWEVRHELELFEWCRHVPPELDLRVQAIRWLGEAARLGHEVAQIKYYDFTTRLLLTYDPNRNNSAVSLRRPELVDEYKILAVRYLREAMSKGHAEAYLAMSQAVYDGIVIDTDLPLAYAYLERAESLTTNINILAAISSRKIEIAQYLDRDQILQAESIAERL